MSTYKSYGFEITARKIPRDCTECPFWAINTRTFDDGICVITGTEIKIDGQQDEKRMDDCPIKLSKCYKKKHRCCRRKRDAKNF